MIYLYVLFAWIAVAVAVWAYLIATAQEGEDE